MPVPFIGTLFPQPRTDQLRDEIALRQLAELKKQVPPLYLLLLANSASLAYSHIPVAPAWMTVGVLGVLSLVCTVRSVQWVRLPLAEITAEEAVRRMRGTAILAVVLSAAFVTWGLALYGYGGPFERGHVTVYISITVIACIFCLTHLPSAAYTVACIVGSVFVAHCLMTNNRVSLAIGINTVFVTLVMVRILANNFAAFLQLADTEADVAREQAEAERLMEENARLAHTDSLTGLPNRRAFFLKVDALIAKSDTHGGRFALGIFDLDRFKAVNDTYGHVVGDRLLVETGRRLATFADANTLVARLSGDEFGILFLSVTSPDAPVEICDRICAALAAPFELSETRLTAGCSAGLALYPDAGPGTDTLFDRADYALYHSKKCRRGLATLFSREHEDAIRAEGVIETALRSADLDAEMELHFQPVLDLSTQTLCLVEALARWRSPTLGQVSPDRFIAAAERCGMIHSVTLLLFRKALAAAERLPAGVGLSFNLSSHDLVSPETVLAIIAAVRTSGVDPRRITLELTETALMGNFEVAQQSILALRALGIAIALDDFGTGYSSLGYVHRLPLDKIKIDRSFMADIDTERGRSIVITVLDLCQNLRLECIAEGVETVEQLETLRGYGCRYVQGYLVGKPMPLDAMMDHLTAPDLRLSA